MNGKLVGNFIDSEKEISIQSTKYLPKQYLRLAKNAFKVRIKGFAWEHRLVHSRPLSSPFLNCDFSPAGNSPSERQLSRVVSRDFRCKQTAEVRTLVSLMCTNFE